MKILIEHLENAFNLTEDLAQSLTEESLCLKLKDLPSNTIGQQFWCIIGARESYTKAIINDGWAGFSCSLQNPDSKEEILKCLKESSVNCMAHLNNHNLNETGTEFLLKLFEHEIQHHGQLIRFVYGNKLSFPKSWNERYTV